MALLLMSFTPFIAVNKEYLAEKKLLSDRPTWIHSLGYIVWSFHLNWLIFLEAVYANKRVPFILVHNVYVLIYIDFISHFLMPL